MGPSAYGDLKHLRIKRKWGSSVYEALYIAPLIQGHTTVPHWKAHSSGKFELRGLNCIGDLSICQGILKRANLLHKQGTVC